MDDRDERVTRLLAGHQPPIQALARRAYELAVAAVPDPVVTADRENLGIGTGPGYKGLVFVLTPRTGYLTIGFYRGTELPDPEGLLEGSGKVHRHVKVRQQEDLDAPAFRDLMAAAAARATR